jgi:hypothetical protein
MQGCKDIQPKMMYQVSLDTLVPADNFFYRKLQANTDRWIDEYNKERPHQSLKFKTPDHYAA